MAVNYKNSLSRYRKYLQTIQQRPMWRATLFVTLSLLLLIKLLLFALRPTFITIAGLVGEIQSKREIETKLNTKIANLQSMVQTYQKIQPQLVLLDQALPVGSKFASLGNYFVQSASHSGVIVGNIVLGNIDLSTKTPAAQISSEIEFSLSAKGNFGQIHNFLQRIESSRRLMATTSVAITQDKTGQLAAVIKGRAFFVLENYSP